MKFSQVSSTLEVHFKENGSFAKNDLPLKSEFFAKNDLQRFRHPMGLRLPLNRGFFAENDLQRKASYGSSPPCRHSHNQLAVMSNDYRAAL